MSSKDDLTMHILIGTFACCGNPHIYGYVIDADIASIEQQTANAIAKLGPLTDTPEAHQVLPNMIQSMMLDVLKHEHPDRVQKAEAAMGLLRA